MLKFLIVDDYTSNPVWDHFLYEGSLRLNSRPFGWERNKFLPEGNWTMGNAMYSFATVEAFSNFGVRRPNYNELPVIFCVKENGSVDELCNVSLEQVVNFISLRIGE